MENSEVAPAALLSRWLRARLDAATMAWIEDNRARVTAGAPERDFYAAFGMAARRVGAEPLRLGAEELEAAARLDGWRPESWRRDEAARALLLLALPSEPDGEFRRRVERLFDCADLRESVALYRALPLLPRPGEWLGRAGEGLRSNIVDVFEAVAHHSPYPRRHFPQPLWNQMILKALFIGSPLDPILGLDERRNPTLGAMLENYAAERRAAGRPVPLELWRALGFEQPARSGE